MLEKQYLQDVAPSRGRFRSFLLASLRHYVSNERDYANAQRRGGGKLALPLEFAGAEAQFRYEPIDERTPDRLYERDWALALLERAITRLKTEFESVGKLDSFHILKSFLPLEPHNSSYKESAERLSTSEGALKVAVHRLRKRYRIILEEEIAATLDNPAEVGEELRFLFGALSG